MLHVYGQNDQHSLIIDHLIIHVDNLWFKICIILTPILFHSKQLGEHS